ncbi:MAG TPA: hypothetical protein VGQ19_09450 [Burkholderiales bacterium]|jgi:hypothetical protein|nr:hypothetical protein [Burkholderiales bacterium]
MSLRKLLIIAGGIPAFLLMCGYAIGSARTMPPNAVVYVDKEAKRYFAAPCVKDTSRLAAATAAEAYGLEYKPDPDCRKSGAFQSADRSLTGLLLVRIGVLDEYPTRWNADGTWKW